MAKKRIPPTETPTTQPRAGDASTETTAREDGRKPEAGGAKAPARRETAAGETAKSTAPAVAQPATQTPPIVESSKPVPAKGEPAAEGKVGDHDSGKDAVAAEQTPAEGNGQQSGAKARTPPPGATAERASPGPTPVPGQPSRPETPASIKPEATPVETPKRTAVPDATVRTTAAEAATPTPPTGAAKAPPPIAQPERPAAPEPFSETVTEPPEPRAPETPTYPTAPAQTPETPLEARAPQPAPEPPPVRSHEHRPSLYIVHVTPEMAPIAKVGGLADVVFGLSRELAIRGNHVEIILPKYDNLRYDHIHGMHEVYRDLWVPWFEGAVHCTVYFGFVHERKCFFIEPHSQDGFFERGSLYGFKDDVLRFAFFSRAAMEFMWKAGKQPDIIHCHDWQTALVPIFLYELYQPLGMHHPRVCLTIHNFLHQGVTGPELLRATGLHRPERFLACERLGDNNHRGALNLLKGGIVYSNFVTTVSPRYAFETKDQGQGFGLEPTLYTHHMKYGGVLNGVDYDVWNPEIDSHLPVRFGVDSIEGKYDNKRALRHRFMLADSDKPIVAFIGRLDPQKGLELVRHAIFYSLERGAQFVLLGSSPDPVINADFWGLKQMLNDSPDCHLEIGFDEDLSHLIYAGADLMLVPSPFEPCGLTQLIALRYGTVPVVRSVGGLADTVFDKDHSLHPQEQRNGYSFETYDAQGLEFALGRAIACFYQYPEHFRELMANAMRADYSWNHPGQDYLNIYDFIRNR